MTSAGARIRAYGARKRAEPLLRGRRRVRLQMAFVTCRRPGTEDVVMKRKTAEGARHACWGADDVCAMRQARERSALNPASKGKEGGESGEMADTRYLSLFSGICHSRVARNQVSRWRGKRHKLGGS